MRTCSDANAIEVHRVVRHWGDMGGVSPATEGTLGGVSQANVRAWTTVANVLFLETPSAVGFSYCTGGKVGKVR